MSLLNVLQACLLRKIHSLGPELHGMHSVRGPLRGHVVRYGNRIVGIGVGLRASGDELQLSPLLRQMTSLSRLQRNRQRGVHDL